MDSVELTAAYWIGLGVSVLLPVLVGLVTTRVTSGGVKAVALAGLSAATGLLTEWGAAADSGRDFDLDTAAVVAGVGWVIATATHFGLYKPAGVSALAQRTLITPRGEDALTRELDALRLKDR
jgi:hypothetical protein